MFTAEKIPKPFTWRDLDGKRGHFLIIRESHSEIKSKEFEFTFFCADDGTKYVIDERLVERSEPKVI